MQRDSATILIVDDNPNNLRVLEGILRVAGHRVRPALGGEVALRSVEAELPDLVLLDIRMPGLDGFEVCRRLKAAQQSRDVPVIFISALQETEEKIHAFQLGGVDYIVKPFQAEEVLARVNTHMELARARRELAQSNLHLEETVSERTRALSDANRELKRSNEDLEAFAHIASHHLQEPLRKIEMFGGRLRSSLGCQLAGEAADDLERMLGAAVRLRLLIADLLAYARASGGGEAGTVELAALVGEIWSDLEAHVTESRAELDMGVLPVLRADMTQLRLLFQNLLSNAIKFRRPGAAPKVRLQAEYPDEGGVCIRVEDNGIGFNNRYAERIFQVFERLNGRAYPGTGVGLAICRKIAERLGGSLTAEGREGEGACFLLVLPASCVVRGNRPAAIMTEAPDS